MLPDATVVVLDRPEGSGGLDVGDLLGPDATLIDISRVEDFDRDEVLAQARAIVVDLEMVDAKLISRLSNCGLIAEFGVGVDNIDVEAATRAGIQVAAVPDYCVDELADHAVAMILALTRGIHLYSRATVAGVWDYRSAGQLRHSSTLRVGIVGHGRVGRAVQARLHGFGFELQVCDPFSDLDRDERGRPFVSLAELVASSDVISLHCPLNDRSRRMIAAPEFAQMKAGAALVNTARGGLVDEAALIRALHARKLSGAALDVLETEPPEKDLALLRMPNVIVTPHAGFYSEDSLRALHLAVFEEVRRFLHGLPSLHPVNGPPSPGTSDKETS